MIKSASLCGKFADYVGATPMARPPFVAGINMLAIANRATHRDRPYKNITLHFVRTISA